MDNKVFYVLRVADGELEGDDASATVGEEGSFLLIHGLYDGNDIARLLCWIQLFWFFDFASRHLAPVIGNDSEMMVKVCENGTELSAMSSAARNQDQQRAVALIPILNITFFVVHRLLGGIERHFHGASMKRKDGIVLAIRHTGLTDR